MYKLTDVTSEIKQGHARAMNQAPDFESAIALVLNKVCKLTDWDYGEAWIPEDEEGSILKLSTAWCISSYLDDASALALEQFRNCSEEFIVSPGEGLPGRVWLLQQPEWIVDASGESEAYFLRNHIAAAFGVKSGWGVPAVINEKIQAVFVFFMLEAKPENPQAIALATKVIMELADWLL